MDWRQLRNKRFDSYTSPEYLANMREYEPLRTPDELAKILKIQINKEPGAGLKAEIKNIGNENEQAIIYMDPLEINIEYENFLISYFISAIINCGGWELEDSVEFYYPKSNSELECKDFNKFFFFNKRWAYNFLVPIPFIKYLSPLALT